MSYLESLIKVCDIHKDRLNMAVSEIKEHFPITGEILESLSNEDMGYLEIMTSRFGKLQDLMGSKLFEAVIKEKVQEVGVSLRDKINQLQKFGIEIEADTWFHLRDIRNHAAHEYPDDYDLLAKNLNNLFDNISVLLNIYDAVKSLI